MKKVYFFTLGVFSLAATLLTSCGGGVSTKPTLKTESDSVAYAMGVNLNEQSLKGFFSQSGIIVDTMEMKRFFEYQISQVTDDAEKAAMQKKLPARIDSLNRANNKNIAEFMRGFQEGVKAPDAQDAYINGLSIGRQISSRMLPGFKAEIYGDKADSIKLNKDALISGVATSLMNMKLAIPNAAMYMEEKMAASRMEKEAAERAKSEGLKAEKGVSAAKFFEENAKQPGVVTLPSGLQYKAVTTGTGVKPKATDMVTAHYKGTFIDGTVFESSHDGGEPIDFPVNGVIRGWTEALQLMPAGSKWILYIPYDLAYGERGSGKIEPYTPLVFEVELIAVK